ncbi:MAG: hypothetical protein PHQ75_14570, partial [Thermoguttaceae bacterium]|nr:hypothetical protein [Thermoguttaceae bacterium]
KGQADRGQMSVVPADIARTVRVKTVSVVPADIVRTVRVKTVNVVPADIVRTVRVKTVNVVPADIVRDVILIANRAGTDKEQKNSVAQIDVTTTLMENEHATYLL